MPRIRSVHPDICQDEALVDVSARAERTFVRLWTHLDDEGRCIDHPKLIKAALYPLHDDMTAAEVDADLWELVRHGLLMRYEAEGKKVLCAKPAAWKQRQKPKHPTPSKLPAPPDSYTPPPEPQGEDSPPGSPNGGSATPHLPQAFPRSGEDYPESLHGDGVGEGVGVGEGEGESRLPASGSEDAERLCHLLADFIDQRGSKRPNVTKAWVTDMDRLIRLDGKEPDEIARVIRWLHEARDETSSFWQANVRCPAKLREKWDQMREQYEREHSRRSGSRQMQDDQAWRDSKTLLRAVPDGANPIDLMLRGAG